MNFGGKMSSGLRPYILLSIGGLAVYAMRCLDPLPPVSISDISKNRELDPSMIKNTPLSPEQIHSLSSQTPTLNATGYLQLQSISTLDSEYDLVRYSFSEHKTPDPDSIAAVKIVKHGEKNMQILPQHLNLTLSGSLVAIDDNAVNRACALYPETDMSTVKKFNELCKRRTGNGDSYGLALVISDTVQ